MLQATAFFCAEVFVPQNQTHKAHRVPCGGPVCAENFATPCLVRGVKRPEEERGEVLAEVCIEMRRKDFSVLQEEEEGGACVPSLLFLPFSPSFVPTRARPLPVHAEVERNRHQTANHMQGRRIFVNRARSCGAEEDAASKPFHATPVCVGQKIWDRRYSLDDGEREIKSRERRKKGEAERYRERETKTETRRDRETERQRDGETERRRDGEKERLELQWRYREGTR
eukprot:2188074-Rhodomonas_salina.1